MKRLTKMIAVFLAAVSVLSILAGCGGKQGESERGEKPVLEYFMPQDPGVDFTDDKWVIQNWGEKTGVTFKLHTINRDVFNEKIAALMASGDLPDLINWREGADDVELYGDKLFVALDDYLEKGKLPNLEKWLEKYPEVKEKGSTLEDGKMYGFPRILDFDNLNSLWQVREDLLNQAGWKAEDIKTLDDLKEALLALKKVSGTPYITTSWGWAYFSEFTGYFFGTSPTMMFDNKVSTGTNKWVFGPKTEGYKTWVEFYRWMYENKLIHPSFATMTQQEANAGYMNGDFVLCMEQAAYGGNLGGFSPTYTTRVEKTIFPVEINGEVPKQPRLHHEDNTSRFPVTVSKSSKYVDAAMNAMDWLYSDEGHEQTVYGQEGVDFVRDDDYSHGYRPLYQNGYYQQQRLAKGEITKEEYEAIPTSKQRCLGSAWLAPVMDKYQRFGSYHKDDTFNKERTEFKLNNIQTVFDNGTVIDIDPLVKFTESEHQEIVDISGALDIYVGEQSLKFIYGQSSMDEWDSFLAQCEALGASKLEKIYNDRYKKMNN